MKKLRKLGLYCTFILFLSGILTVLLLTCKDSLRETSDIDIVNQENEKIEFVHHPCLIISSRDVTLHANCENKNFTHDRFLAYRGDFNRGNTETNFSLKSPFPSNEHPQSLLNKPFFEAYSENGRLYVHSISGVLPFWDFSKKEDRNLDYTIYHQIRNSHKELVFNQKMMKVDFLYFSPYHENENFIYVLSWNPAEDISETVEIKDNVILFPVKKEKEKRIGLIISPQVKVKRNKTNIAMSANFYEAQFRFRLNFKIIDNDKCWILSWRKINKNSHRR